MIITPEIKASRQDLVDWVQHRDMLVNHIINGAARGLYPEQVASIAASFLEPVEEQLTEQLAATIIHGE